MEITLHYYLLLSSLLFTIGIIGIALNRGANIQSIISSFFISISVIINFVSCSYFIEDITGQIFSILLLAISAAEIIVGLSIVLHAKKHSFSMNGKSDNE